MVASRFQSKETWGELAVFRPYRNRNFVNRQSGSLHGSAILLVAFVPTYEQSMEGVKLALNWY